MVFDIINRETANNGVCLGNLTCSCSHLTISGLSHKWCMEIHIHSKHERVTSALCPQRVCEKILFSISTETKHPHDYIIPHYSCQGT